MVMDGLTTTTMVILRADFPKGMTLLLTTVRWSFSISASAFATTPFCFSQNSYEHVIVRHSRFYFRECRLIIGATPTQVILIGGRIVITGRDQRSLG
uniref:Uncharacterized protein n=1 Tax=Nelumbo nucifera TaxID=4432 RepID=A0A822Z9N8_NELNU|nr:TPA_asm: hypothetical protein HUJ06_014422 [Nelumbo nucifera]